MTDIENRTAAILREIRDEVRTTNTRLDPVQRSFSDHPKNLEQGLDARLDELRELNDRIDNVLTGALGQTVRDHDRRATAPERGRS